MLEKIGTQQRAFFRYELERGDAQRKKRALQDLCALYRRGHFLPIEAIDAFEALINRLVLQSDQDLKVVRWCLNALAQFGRMSSSCLYVEAALQKYAGSPSISANTSSSNTCGPLYLTGFVIATSRAGMV